MRAEENSKNKILNAAKELFAEKGYSATTIREIALKADSNSALIQYHFKGKQGLLIAIISELMDGEFKFFSEMLNVDVESFDELKIVLHIFLDAVIVRALEKFQILKIMKNEAFEISQIESFPFKDISLSFLKNLEIFLNKAKKKSLIAKDINTAVLSDNLQSLAIDKVLAWQTDKHILGFDLADKTTRKNWISQTLRLYFYGISHSPSKD